jgi:hypothetical protein
MATKTVRWIIGLAFGLVGCLVLAVYLWWHSSGAAFFKGTATNMMDGRRIGRLITASACVDSGLARNAANMSELRAKGDTIKPNMTALTAAPVFLEACMSVSQPSPELCVGIPPRTERNRSMTWAGEECRRRKVEDRDCPTMMLTLQLACEQKARLNPAG